MTIMKLVRTATALAVFVIASSVCVCLCDAARFSAGGKKVEYYRNHPLTGSEDYDRAVIVIHGYGRNADEYYDSVLEAKNVFPGVGTKALVLAPRFKTIDDNPADDELYWSNGGWIYGRESLDGQEYSSFAVADGLLETISSRFPKVTEIVIAGHGAGAQFIQRYSGVGAVLDIRCDIRVRYVVSNPGSYMYPTSERPRSIQGCSEEGLFDEVLPLTLNETSASRYTFGLKGVDACPSGTISIIDPDTCSDAAAFANIPYAPGDTDTGLCVIKYLGTTNTRVTMTTKHGSNAAWLCERLYDKYRYGISDLPNGLNYTSLSIAEIRTNLVNREVFLLLGTEDNSRVASPAPDTSCEADTQGMYRYERGTNYYDSIKAFDCSARTTVAAVPNVGHDHHDMFISPQGIMLLFIG